MRKEPQQLKDAQRGYYLLIYTSPKMFFKNRSWQHLLANLEYRLQLSFISIDEAHCISEYGIDYNKQFSKLGHLCTLCT